MGAGYLVAPVKRLDRGLGAALFCLLLGAYLLVYTPRVDSIDGQAILAVSASLARTGTFQIGQIGAQDSLLPQQMARMGAFGLDGQYYSKKGLTPSLFLLPFVWLADLTQTDLRATAMLFNPLVTALTGVLLYGLVSQLGYAARTAFLTALLYGLATFALVYAKTLYAEPLAALLLTLAVKTLLQRGRAAETQRNLPSAALPLCFSSSENRLPVRDKALTPSPSPIAADGGERGVRGLFSSLGSNACFMSSCSEKLGVPGVLAVQNPEVSASFAPSRLSISYLGVFVVHRHSAVFSGLCLGLLMGINLAYVVFVPFVLGWVVFSGRAAVQPHTLWRPLRLGGLLLLPVVVCAALIALYNLARFGALTSTGYHFAAGEGFTRPFLEGFLGQLISPYRGLLWYNPLLLLALPGWLMLRRAQPAAAWLLLGLIGLGVSAFAAWWSWEGGIAWGARFTVTITPLVAVCLAPLVAAIGGKKEEAGSKWQVSGFKRQDAVADSKPQAGSWKLEAGNRQPATGNRQPIRLLLAAALIGLALLSFCIQLLGAAYSLYPYVQVLYQQGGGDVTFDPLHSAVLGQLALAAAGWPLEPAWIATGVNLPHMLVTLLLIAAATAYVVQKTFTAEIQRSQSVGATRRIAPTEFILEMALPLCLSAVSLFLIPRLYMHSSASIREVEAMLEPPGRVLVASTHFDESLLDMRLRQPVISTNAPTAPDDPLAVALTTSALGGTGADNLWLVTWFPPGTASNWQERRLWECCAFALERGATGHRALLFSLEPPPPIDRPVNAAFGDQVRLTGYGVQRTADGLLISLGWEPGTVPAEGLAWFAHLLDADGNTLAQQDRVPAGGFAFVDDGPLTDHLYFPGGAAGVQLRLGWVNVATGERLPVRTEVGQVIDEGYILLETNSPPQ
jgi:hypothetical protein